MLGQHDPPSRHPARDRSGRPYAALRADPGLQSILQASVYDEAVTTRRSSTPTASSSCTASRGSSDAGARQSQRTSTGWRKRRIKKLEVIYSGDGRTLEARQLMVVDDEAFGSIRVGVSTLLMRSALNESLGPALLTVAIALVIAVFVAGLLAQVLLRPIHVIRSGLTRLGRGEFGVTLDLPPGDEFGELGSFFNTVSQQLSADRSLLADQKANLQSLVEHLEDAVALFNPSGELLFSNPAMQPTLPSSSVGSR